MRAISCIAGVCLLLAGCASSGPLGKDVLSAGIAPKKSRLVLYRTSALGFAVQPDYVIDVKPVAPSQPQGIVVCHLGRGKDPVSVGNFELNVNFGGGSDKAGVAVPQGASSNLQG